MLICGVVWVDVLFFVKDHLLILPVKRNEPPYQCGNDISQHDPIDNKDALKFLCFIRHINSVYPNPMKACCEAFAKNYFHSGGSDLFRRTLFLPPAVSLSLLLHVGRQDCTGSLRCGPLLQMIRWC